MVDCLSQRTGWCRIAAGGDKRFRQSRLGSDAADSFRQEEDAFDKEDFSKFDEPTRIEGEGGSVDLDPGDRDSVSVSFSHICHGIQAFIMGYSLVVLSHIQLMLCCIQQHSVKSKHSFTNPLEAYCC